MGRKPMMKMNNGELMIEYARKIKKADKEDYHGSTDDICDYAILLSNIILGVEE